MENEPQTEPITTEQKSAGERRWEERHAQKLAERAASRRRKIKRRLLVWGSVILGIALISGGVAWLVTHTELGDVANGTVEPIKADDRVKGNPEAQLSLIEYSDFQCPACRSYFPMVKQLLEESGDSVRFAYRHFPLTQIHRNAKMAAQAAEAAGMQGKFWEMHDMLFERQPEWAELSNPVGSFESYAGALGLDTNKWSEDLNSTEVKDKVENDYASGITAGVRGTPTFYVNGSAIENPRDVAEFKALIEAKAESLKSEQSTTSTNDTPAP